VDAGEEDPRASEFDGEDVGAVMGRRFARLYATGFVSFATAMVVTVMVVDGAFGGEGGAAAEVQRGACVGDLCG